MMKIECAQRYAGRIHSWMMALATICVLLAATGMNGAFAHELEEIRLLRNQLDRLEQRLLLLEQRESGQSSNSRSRTSRSNDSTVQQGDPWDRLYEGMRMGDVERLLGRPGKVHETDGKTNWFYPDLLGGSVHFENGVVASWQKP